VTAGLGIGMTPAHGDNHREAVSPQRARAQGIVVTGNQWESAYRFRGALLQALCAQGLEVHVIGPAPHDLYRQRIEAFGVQTHQVPFSRAGLNPLVELRTLLAILRIYRRIQPDIALSYFAKPVIYGSLAARWSSVPRCYSLIAGLGYVFTPSERSANRRRATLERMVRALYRMALKCNDRVFFQNPDDLDQFISEGLVSRERSVRVNGTGVALDFYRAGPPVTDPVTFVLAARLVAEKGIREYAAAARLLRQRGWSLRCILLGPLDDNPSAIDVREVDEWVEQDHLEWPGSVDDVRPWLEASSVYVLPSYYREGVPRSIQEAMAIGRAVITADSTGCRETVEPGRNGFLVTPRDVDSLAAAMEHFLRQPQAIVEMGLESRQLAEERFDVHAINRQMLQVMGIDPAC